MAYNHTIKFKYYLINTHIHNFHMNSRGERKNHLSSCCFPTFPFDAINIGKVERTSYWEISNRHTKETENLIALLQNNTHAHNHTSIHLPIDSNCHQTNTLSFSYGLHKNFSRSLSPSLFCCVWKVFEKYADICVCVCHYYIHVVTFRFVSFWFPLLFIQLLNKRL